MTKEFSANRLDVKAFAQAGARLSGHESLLKYERLVDDWRKLGYSEEILEKVFFRNSERYLASLGLA